MFVPKGGCVPTMRPRPVEWTREVFMVKLRPALGWAAVLLAVMIAEVTMETRRMATTSTPGT